MAELVEPKVMQHEPSADSAAESLNANKRALHFMLGAQRMILEEMVFAANAMLDRVRGETHLFGELAARLAEAHSVRDLNATGAECGRHQLDFIRRDCDRLFRHSGLVIEASFRLFDEQFRIEASASQRRDKVAS